MLAKVRLLGATLAMAVAAMVLASGALATNSHPKPKPKPAPGGNCSGNLAFSDPSCLLKQKAKNTATVSQTGNAQSGPAQVNGGTATGGTVTSTGGAAPGGTATAAAPWIVVTKSTANGAPAQNNAPVSGGSPSSTANGGANNPNASATAAAPGEQRWQRRHADRR